MSLRLYTTPYCPYCDVVRDELDRLALEYEEIQVSMSRRDRDDVFALTGQRLVPVLVDGPTVVADSARILAHLRKSFAA